MTTEITDTSLPRANHTQSEGERERGRKRKRGREGGGRGGVKRRRRRGNTELFQTSKISACFGGKSHEKERVMRCGGQRRMLTLLVRPPTPTSSLRHHSFFKKLSVGVQWAAGDERDTRDYPSTLPASTCRPHVQISGSMAQAWRHVHTFRPL